MEYERIYQAINAISERVNDLAHRMDEYCSMRVDEITPYTATQTAYYGESEKVFYDVPQGNITVFFDNDYSVSRLDGTVTIRFEAVTENTDITIMIQ